MGLSLQDSYRTLTVIIAYKMKGEGSDQTCSSLSVKMYLEAKQPSMIPAKQSLPLPGESASPATIEDMDIELVAETEGELVQSVPLNQYH